MIQAGFTKYESKFRFITKYKSGLTMNPNPDFIIEYPPSPNRNRVGHKPTNMAQLYTKKRYSACRETADGLREVLPEYNQPTTRRLTFPVKDYNKMIQH